MRSCLSGDLGTPQASSPDGQCGDAKAPANGWHEPEEYMAEMPQEQAAVELDTGHPSKKAAKNKKKKKVWLLRSAWSHWAWSWMYDSFVPLCHFIIISRAVIRDNCRPSYDGMGCSAQQMHVLRVSRAEDLLAKNRYENKIFQRPTKNKHTSYGGWFFRVQCNLHRPDSMYWAEQRLDIALCRA